MPPAVRERGRPVRVEKIGSEWCAFADNGREVARSHSKELLAAYLDDEPTNEEINVKISYRTRARSTGASTASGRTTDGGWGAICLSHGDTASADSGTAAEKLTSKPQEWCSDCGNIFDGVLPKVAKNAELDDLI